jgi:hypothetical protein
MPFEESMSRLVLMDELHVQLAIPPNLPTAARIAVRRHLSRPAFRRQVVRAVRAVLAGVPALTAVRVRLAR